MVRDEQGLDAAVADVVIVIGHGRRDSLCHELARVAAAEVVRLGATATVQDLLSDGFDPVARLAAGDRHAALPSAQEDPLVHRYGQAVRRATHWIIVHPAWWFAPPAILKGWVDRVLVDGVALRRPTPEAGGGPPRPALSGRRALLIQTFAATRFIDRFVFRDLARRFWTRAVFTPIGMRLAERLSLYRVEAMSPARVDAARERVRAAVRRLLGSSQE